jgi:tape measure domain-containing protein
MPVAQKNMSIRLAVVDGKRVESEFEQIGRTGQNAFDRISAATKPANASLKAVDTTAQALNGVFRQAAGLVGAYAGLSGIMQGLRSVNETGMAFQGLNTALAAVTGSAQGASAEMAFLKAESERLGLNLLDTAQGYLQIAAAAKGTTLEGQRTRDIFTAITEASTVLQLSADQTSGALRAIGQIMSKGKVQAEELRGQLGERLYGAFQLAARGMGVTTAELDKMLVQGKLVADDFLPKFAAEIRKTFSEGVPEASQTARAELNRFHNSVLEIERTIAQGGFLQGLTTGYRTLAATLQDPSVQDAARALGETLGETIVTAAKALSLLIENADLAVTALEGLLIARVVAGAIASFNMAVMGNAGMAVGLQLASSLSTGFAMRLVAVEAATRLATLAMVGFRAALAFVGGPVGLAIIAGVALYKLASGHDAAAKAAHDHAEELKEIKDELGSVAKSADNASQALSNNEAIYRYTKQLETARQNIIDVKKELQFEGIGNFFDQAARFGKPLQNELYDIRTEFNTGKISAEQYSEALFKLATKYPDFGKQAEGVQQQVLALLAAERAAKKAAAALDELRNPKAKTEVYGPAAPPPPKLVELSGDEVKKIRARVDELAAEEQALKRLNDARRQGAEAVKQATVVNEQEQALRRVGLQMNEQQGTQQAQYADQIKSTVANIEKLKFSEKQYQDQQREGSKSQNERKKILEDVKNKYAEIDKTTVGAIQRADEWYKKALTGLDATAKGYDEFKLHVDAVYNHMLKDAREEDLKNSKRWEDGVIRGLKTVREEAMDMASQSEKFVSNAFKSMEDALVDFVKTGKMDFGSLVDSIISDLIRMQIRASITAPLSGALSDFFGGLFGGGSSHAPAAAPTPHAHTGGVIGIDRLGSRPISPSVFDGAPRFHSGGIVGQEVPIIAKQGEAVFTPGQMNLLGDALNSKPNVNVSIKVENNVSNAQVGASMAKDSSGNLSLNIIIEEIESTMVRNVSRGEGLAPMLERRYGLNPAAGSYR